MSSLEACGGAKVTDAVNVVLVAVNKQQWSLAIMCIAARTRTQTSTCTASNHQGMIRTHIPCALPAAA